MAVPQYKNNYARPISCADIRSKHATTTVPALKKTKVVKRRVNPIATLVRCVFFALFLFYIAPCYTDNVTRPVVLKSNKYPTIKSDINMIANPTLAYLSNNHMLGVNFLSATNVINPKMQRLYETYPLVSLESSIHYLAQKYPTLKPSVYVWDYESGKYANYNSDVVYPAASIIKIPVLIQLFKSIETGKISLNDKITMTDYYLSEGSGSLQFKGKNATYTVDDLARVMITESDNSATNMLLDATGGMNAMNSSLRKWGMKDTRINDWLPDLPGTNTTTAKEMATLLYNLDNPNFLSLNSREKMVDYMGHVHNNRLIQAGLPSDAIFVHKTGDIGKMLGDAGIVYTPSGKRYIVVMLVNRPYNSYQGKEFIVEASSMIYNYIAYSNL